MVAFERLNYRPYPKLILLRSLRFRHPDLNDGSTALKTEMEFLFNYPYNWRDIVTRVHVDPGACGFICLIQAERAGKYKATTLLESQCGQVSKLAAEICEVDFLEIMKAAFGMNRVFQCAAACKLHQSCPVPTALIKAVEAEVGMAVKKNVTIVLTGGNVENRDCSQCRGIEE